MAYIKIGAQLFVSCAPIALKKYLYFTSSKTTLTDYQCVSTGCCTHVAKTEITIDNQHVTKSLQRYRFLPKQPKENTEKITFLPHFLDLDFIGVYPLSASQSICRCLLKDSGTPVVSWLSRLQHPYCCSRKTSESLKKRICCSSSTQGCFSSTL